MAFSAPVGYFIVSHRVLEHLDTTYTELDGYREELGTGSLRDGVATFNTWEVDEARLDDTLLAIDGLDYLLGKAFTVSGSMSLLCSVTYRKPA